MQGNPLSPLMEGACTAAEAARVLAVDRATITRWIQAGILPPVAKLPGLRGAYLLDASLVEAFAADPEAVTKTRAALRSDTN